MGKPELHSLLTGLAFGESPGGHDGRLWFSNWGVQEVVALDLAGRSEVVVRVPTTIPFCIDWLPDGHLLVVSGREGLPRAEERVEERVEDLIPAQRHGGHSVVAGPHFLWPCTEC